MDCKQEKRKFEIQSLIVMRDSDIHKKNEENLEKVIE